MVILRLRAVCAVRLENIEIARSKLLELAFTKKQCGLFIDLLRVRKAVLRINRHRQLERRHRIIHPILHVRMQRVKLLTELLHLRIADINRLGIRGTGSESIDLEGIFHADEDGAALFQPGLGQRRKHRAEIILKHL